MSEKTKAAAVRFLRLRAVCEKTGLGKSSVWAYSKTGKYGFPKPVHVSAGVTAWRLDELEAWMSSRPRFNAEGAENE